MTDGTSTEVQGKLLLTNRTKNQNTGEVDSTATDEQDQNHSTGEVNATDTVDLNQSRDTGEVNAIITDGQNQNLNTGEVVLSDTIRTPVISIAHSLCLMKYGT